MAIKSTRVRIRNRWWGVKVARPPIKGNADGLCDFEAKQIYIKPGAELPSTLIHEVLHACYPDLDEDAILAGEEAVMNGLKKMGLLIP
jgi:hypothetical protein